MNYVRTIKTERRTESIPCLRQIAARRVPRDRVEEKAQELAGALGRPVEATQVTRTYALNEYLVDNGGPYEPRHIKKWVLTGEPCAYL